MKALYNFIAFQAGWFACALGAGGGRPEWALAALAVLLTVHLTLIGRGESALLLTAGLIGGLNDSVLGALGVLQFNHPPLPGWLAPVWLIALWMLFASTLRHSLAWLKNRYPLAAVSGALAGPACYYAGDRFGALTLGQPETITLLWIGALWALWMPVLVWLAHEGPTAPAPRHGRFKPPPAP